jgi:predicted MPP superfamily phosphohydrolase
LKVLIPQLCSILLFGAAGLCIFLMLLNRFLLLRPDGALKTAFVFVTLFAIMSGSVVSGYLLYEPPWVFAPASILGLIVVGEVRRSFVRRTCAGSKPLESIPHRIDLLKPITTTDVIIHRYEVGHTNWNGPRLRIVHITDLHVSHRLPVEYYERALWLADQTQPDLAVFTGDFITKLSALPQLRAVLRPISGAATFAVLGNHDYWADPEAVRSVITEAGFRLLTGESVSCTIHGREILVTGYDYPWETNGTGIPSSRQDVLHLVLTHTPDNIYRLSKSSADIVFSGHYHAGQIRLPFFGPVVIPSVYGRRFDHGHFLVNGTHLFVAGGVGVTNPPIRLYCPPDLFVVDILAGKMGELSANRE